MKLRAARARQAPSCATTDAIWRERPYQTIDKAADLTCRSKAHIYQLIHNGQLKAVTLGGKTLVETGSMITFLERARRWHPDRERVAAANRKRAEISKV
jgi:excisionase family DNA binding protein